MARNDFYLRRLNETNARRRNLSKLKWISRRLYGELTQTLTSVL